MYKSTASTKKKVCQLIFLRTFSFLLPCPNIICECCEPVVNHRDLYGRYQNNNSCGGGVMLEIQEGIEGSESCTAEDQISTTSHWTYHWIEGWRQKWHNRVRRWTEAPTWTCPRPACTPAWTQCRRRCWWCGRNGFLRSKVPRGPLESRDPRIC